MKSISKLFLLALLVVFSGCSNDDDPVAPIIPAANNCTSSISFFQTGKTLTYKVSQFGTEAGTMKWTIGTCNGSGFLVTRETFNTGGTLTASGIDLWKQNGDFLLADSNNNGDYFSKIYKKNAVVGDSWQVTRPDQTIVNHEVVATNVSVTVPAGTFNCTEYLYTTSSTINESHIFWNDEVGEIKEDAGFMVLELQSHN